MSADPGAPPLAAPAPPGAAPALDPERWLDDHGDYLYRYALLRLRDPALAQDVVQEALLAALGAHRRFAGRSSERTWLVGILKNKIVDSYRTRGRETPSADLEFLADEQRECFHERGPWPDHWIDDLGPKPWAAPDESLERAEFWRAFRECSAKLPRAIATVFQLRELDGLDTPAICDLLDITANNLWVMLHRARMALRRCLESSWFART